LRKKIESKIHSKFPEQWVPLYSQVKFSNIPYSEALKKGQAQDKIMEAILSIKGIENAWDSEEMEQEILKKMGL